MTRPLSTFIKPGLAEKGILHLYFPNLIIFSSPSG